MSAANVPSAPAVATAPSTTPDQRSLATLAERLRAAPFELIMSSGFFGFYAHAGVIAAIEEAGLVPTLAGGSSAGALVTGLWAAGLPAARIRDRLMTLRRDEFWDLDPTLGLGRLLGGCATGLGLLRGEAFSRLLDDSLAEVGARRLGDCRVPLRVVAFDIDRRETCVLGDPDVPLSLALRASCSFPGLFQPTRIESRRYLDGGIGDRAGIQAATPGTRVLFHHLVPRSPWRKIHASQNEPPAWPDLVLLSEPGLPRLGPFRMERGAEAYELAYQMAKRALQTPPTSRREP
jgi:NTE family protein